MNPLNHLLEGYDDFSLVRHNFSCYKGSSIYYIIKVWGGGGVSQNMTIYHSLKGGGRWQLYDSMTLWKKCKYTKRDQLRSFYYTIWPQMVPSIQIWVSDQVEHNRGDFTGIKDENSLNIYVKCDCMSKYDNMMVI